MANLVINFEAPSPDPINGYIVKYRKKGTIPYTTLIPNPKSSPITIPNTDLSQGYEGTIQCDCSNSITGSTTTFSIEPCTGVDKKRINGMCQTGVKGYMSSVPNQDGTFTCTYRYVFIDGSFTENYTEISIANCVDN